MNNTNDLPPEGTECEVMLESGKWQWCRVVANRGRGSWITTESEDRVIRNDLVRWRTIQSERDRVIETVAGALGIDCPLPEVLNVLWDIGALKLPEEKVCD